MNHEKKCAICKSKPHSLYQVVYPGGPADKIDCPQCGRYIIMHECFDRLGDLLKMIPDCINKFRHTIKTHSEKNKSLLEIDLENIDDMVPGGHSIP